MADILFTVEENVLPELAETIKSKTGRTEPMTLPEFKEEVETLAKATKQDVSDIGSVLGGIIDSTVDSIKDKIEELLGSANDTTGKDDETLEDGVGSLIGGYGQGGSGIQLPEDMLEGLKNGYDVMFYDEYNMGLAFYSVKQGHGINPPIYNCKNWKTSNGANVSFPYTPSADTILYANNDTYASTLYKYYGVDSVLYPYLGIGISQDNICNIIFGDKIRTSTSTLIMFENSLRTTSSVALTSISDYSNLDEVCSVVMACVSKNAIPTTSETKKSFAPGSSAYTYVNFDASALTLNIAPLRLDQ